MTLQTIQEPEPPAPSSFWQIDHPLWRLGFRPFYLLAAAFAALSVPLWTAYYFGWLSGWPHVGLSWHMHEMVFGMVIAVVIGFLYTAGRNWTGLPTPTKAHLAGLAVLWLAGRIAMLTTPALLAAIIDVLFLPFAAWPLYRVLRQSGNKRNLFLVGLLSLLGVANILFHGAVLGWLRLAPALPIQAAILIVVVIESVIGARVIPMFTTNGAPGVEPFVHPQRDKIALALIAGASAAWIAGLPAPAVAALAGAAACAMSLRLAGWKPHRTLQVPLLWILHVSYGWIPIGFLLLALAALNVVSASAAFHALAVGSMGGLILGMMTRTSLGHTGRPLVAGRAESAMYVLIQIGAFARVWAAIDTSALRNGVLIAGAVCWSVAFLLFVIVYTPYLFGPRIDGKEG